MAWPGIKVLPVDANGLNEHDRVFVAAYARDFDGAKAIEAAFPGTVKHPANYAKTLLARPEIQAAITEITTERRKRYAIDAERVLLEFASVGFTKLTEVVDFDGKKLKVKSFDDLTPEQQAAIAEVSETVDASGKRTIKVKMHPKVQALESLGKHLKLWNEGNNVNLLVANLTALPDDTLERRVRELIAKTGASDAEFVEHKPAKPERRDIFA